MKFRQIDRFLVDVDSPAAVRYFNKSLCAPWSNASRILNRFPRLTRVRGTTVATKNARVIVTDYPESTRRRTVMVLFAGDEPAQIVKIRSLPADGASLGIEAEACERVHRALPKTTPKVI